MSSACATMVRGKSEMLHISTEPSGALVSLSTGQQCTSPCGVEVARRGDIQVTVEKENCVTLDVLVGSRMDTVGMLSLIGAPVTALGGLILGAETIGGDLDYVYSGIMVLSVGLDLSSGAAFSREPNPLTLRLDCTRDRASND